jgi:hypothetical protein
MPIRAYRAYIDSSRGCASNITKSNAFSNEARRTTARAAHRGHARTPYHMTQAGSDARNARQEPRQPAGKLAPTGNTEPATR